MQNIKVELRLPITPATARALTRVAEDQYPSRPFIEHAAGLVFLAALANYHLLKPHIDRLSDYCRREGRAFGEELADQLALAFPAKKKKGKKQP